MIIKKIEKIKQQVENKITSVKSADQLEELRVSFLGRKSKLIGILKSLKDLSVEKKKEIGSLANKTREKIDKLIKEKQEEIEKKEILEKEWIDITMPVKGRRLGDQHILSQIQKEVEDIFTTMGFEVADGPEISTEWYNFDALNVPADHPARDMQDTFWIKQKIADVKKDADAKILPRTQTSNTQVQYMEKNQPPLRIVVPGRVFRNEATDASHEHTFYQFEALVVDKNISVANFKDIAQKFFTRFFGKEINIRLRPSYFPFTEPSFEFDITCTVCEGKGCRTCKKTGWLEIGGAGMVNQKVFESAGYNRGDWQGFAWGFGLNRLAMMKYKIDNIRLLMGNDLRFNRQF